MTFELSIVLPCYNEVGNIGVLISGIRNSGWDGQTTEIIVVDDRSTDGTSELLERLQERDKAIRVFTPPSRLGLSKSILHGIEKSTGPIIAVMDTDGIHDPSHLALMVNQLNSNTKLIIGSRYVSGGAMQGALYPHLSKVMNIAIKRIVKSRVSDQLCGFFVADRSELLSVPKHDFDGFGEYFIRLINHFEKRSEIIEIPTVHNVRAKGKRKSIRRKMAVVYLKTAWDVRRSK
jgi:dolichol-phosphate mannosyltransferase